MTNRSDFPLFDNHPTLIYLDSAATTQKPKSVIEAVTFFYENENANVRRGVYNLTAKATNRYENTRVQIQQFIGAQHPQSIVFTKGTTESINIVAHCFAAPRLHAGDEILISAMEHHANLIPWQQICLQKKAHLKIIPLTETGDLDVEIFQKMLHPRVKMVAVTHLSNVLGTVNPIEALILEVKKHQIPILVDMAQSIASHTVDVADWEVDFVAFSGHKMYAPTGVGILYGQKKHLENMLPFQFGGDMIKDVSFEKTIFAAPPHRFEGGTPNAAGIAGLSAAIDYLQTLGQQNIYNHIDLLTKYCIESLRKIPMVQILGNPSKIFGVVSFTIENIHPHDIATILDSEFNIAVRAGQHCAQPLADLLEVPATVRVSFGIYNQKKDIDKLVEGILWVITLFR
jgi:cysteine desulfurase / selenocysteine lyase